LVCYLYRYSHLSVQMGHKNKKSNGGGKAKNKNTGAGAGAGNGSAAAAAEPITIDSISVEFKTVMLDFLRDIDCSFPEYRETLSRYLGYSHEMKPMPDDLYIELYSYCKMIYPARFFDILYKNEEVFKGSVAGAEAGSAGTCGAMFLPNVDFGEIWQTGDITENTKDIIWKYLQLILFSIVNNLSDMGSFGDTAKLFEAIDEGELKSKLEEVIGSISSFFDASGNEASGNNAGGDINFEDTFKKASEFMNSFMPEGGSAESAGSDSSSQHQQHHQHQHQQQQHQQQSSSTPPIPDASSIHEHLSSILNGKIGKLAKEIAEETAADLDLNMENETSMKGVFQQLLKNPTKLSGIIKSVGNKLDSKLKSGELKESEIMQEASELMNKMKSMPGMNNIASMLSKMGMNMPGGMGGGGGGGGGGKVNFGAMQAQLQKNMKQAQMRERLMKKVQEKNGGSGSGPAPTTSVFRTGEKNEKTPRFPAAATTQAAASAASAAAAAAAEARMLSAETQNKKKDKQE
jgi:hypothetical protein